MKDNFTSIRDMAEVFCDSELIPRRLIKNYYLLLCDFMNEKYLTKNSIIFSNLRRCIENLEPKRKRYVILRYGLVSSKTLTLTDIGEQYGVTRESVRQILEKTLRELNGSKIKFYVPCRVNYLKRRNEEIEKELFHLNNIVNTSKEFIPTVNNIGLSIRAIHALERAKITTYEQLMQLTPCGLKEIRNIGSKTANEIWFKLHGEDLTRA